MSTFALDNPEKDCEKSFHLLVQLDEASRCLGKRRLTLTPCSHKVRELGVPHKVDPVYQSLQHLIGRPWFSRAWIVQEIMVGQRSSVCCGNLKISWEAFI